MSATTKTWTTPLPAASTCRACLNGGLLHRMHHRTRRVERWVRMCSNSMRMPEMHVSVPQPRLAMPRRAIAARLPSPRLPSLRLPSARLPSDLWKRTEHLRFSVALIGMVALFYAMSQYRAF